MGVIMDPEQIKRAAMLMNLKYGKGALPKAVDTAKFYLEDNDNDAAKRWISIGYAVKEIQGLVSESDIEEKVS